MRLMSKVRLQYRHNVALGLGAISISLFSSAAIAGSVNWGEIQTSYSLVGVYGAAMRLEDPNDGVINSSTRASVPISEELKFPESNNFDDGDRNFRKGAIVNNRATFLGEVEFKFRDYGLLFRGDGFYDRAYRRRNDNDSPDTLNTSQEPHNSFTESAREFSGGRERLLDAYAYGTMYFGDSIVFSARLGRHIAAWGQSLFFNGLALTQATADATKATVPGADVKSILLPINQFSTRTTLTDKLTALAQFQFEFKPFELNPVGEFYSVADVVGPGAELAYGIKNPFHPDVLPTLFPSDGNQTVALAQTIGNAFDPSGSGQSPLDFTALGPVLSGVSLPGPAVAVAQDVLREAFRTLVPANTPTGLNPTRGPDILPDSNDHQWGAGLEYAMNFTTTVGAYYLRYHQATPAPVFNFPSDPGTGIVLIPGRGPGGPNDPTEIDTTDINLFIPSNYQIKYFDNVDLYAVGMSTVFLGLNWGAEAIRRQGIDVLVDVDEGISGPVPTPTRANSSQGLVNVIYAGGPKFFWDSFTFVAEVSYARVDGIKGARSKSRAARDTVQPGSVPQEDLDREYSDLTFDQEAFGFATLSFIDIRNIFSGWDLRIPISFQGAPKGRPALAGAFGSLFDQDDYRFGFSFDFTHLQNLTLGVGYSGFIGGKAHYLDQPLQDRDVVFGQVKYNFL